MPSRVRINPHPLPASMTTSPSNHSILKKGACHSCVDHGYPTQNHVQHWPLDEYSMPSPVHLASAAHREYIVLTLDDLFYGKEVHVEYTRWKQHGEREATGISIKIPPNCPDGAAWVFPKAGHLLSNGKYQDMYFQVAVEQDRRGFRREGNNVRLSGPDGTSYPIEVDYCWTRARSGSTPIRAKGLPIYNAKGRGDLIFDWEIVFPSSL